MKTEHLMSMIDTIVEEFDYQRIQNVMQLINWKWCKKPGSIEDKYFPTVEEMKERVRHLFKQCIIEGFCYPENLVYTADCGGFEAIIDKRYGNILVDLRFNIEDFSLNAFEEYPQDYNIESHIEEEN